MTTAVAEPPKAETAAPAAPVTQVVTPPPSAPAATPAPVAAAPVVPEKPASPVPAAGAAPAESLSLLADPPKTGGAAPVPGDKPASEAAAAPAAPEFKLTTPDKSPLAAATVEKLTAWAKDAKLPQAEAQKLVDQLHAESVAGAEAAKVKAESDYKTLYKTWGDEVKADKEFGGDKLAPTLDQAKRALRVFASADERAFLEKTPFGNHPILVKILARMGAKISEDGFVAGAGNPAPQKTPAQVAYGSDHTKPSSFR